MRSKLFFSLDEIKPQYDNAAGSMTSVTGADVPGFVNIAFSILKLNRSGSLEPIWHPNAHKLGYCLEGHAMVSIRSAEGVEIFDINEGEMFFIPQGSIHHIANLADKKVVLLFALSHTHPQAMCLSNAVLSLSDAAFASTFNSKPDFLNGLKKGAEPALIKIMPAIKKLPGSKPNSFKFNIAASQKTIQTQGGYLQNGTKSNLPVLEGLGLLAFGLKPKGIVEPHWHTNAGELVYIIKGETRITVLSPDGKVDVLEVKAGEGAFAPASYFHLIENSGGDDVEVMAFFNHAQPDYIGIGEVVGAYSNDLLASVFNVDPNYFAQLKKPQEPLVIVPI